MNINFNPTYRDTDANQKNLRLKPAAEQAILDTEIPSSSSSTGGFSAIQALQPISESFELQFQTPPTKEMTHVKGKNLSSKPINIPRAPLYYTERRVSSPKNLDNSPPLPHKPISWLKFQPKKHMKETTPENISGEAKSQLLPDADIQQKRKELHSAGQSKDLNKTAEALINLADCQVPHQYNLYAFGAYLAEKSGNTELQAQAYLRLFQIENELARKHEFLTKGALAAFKSDNTRLFELFNRLLENPAMVAAQVIKNINRNYSAQSLSSEQSDTTNTSEAMGGIDLLSLSLD